MEYQGKGQIKTIAIKSYKNKQIKGKLENKGLGEGVLWFRRSAKTFQRSERPTLQSLRLKLLGL